MHDQDRHIAIHKYTWLSNFEWFRPLLHWFSKLIHLIYNLICGTYLSWPVQDLAGRPRACLSCLIVRLYTYIRIYMTNDARADCFWICPFRRIRAFLLGALARRIAYLMTSVYQHNAIYAAPCHTCMPSDAVMHNCAGGDHTAQNGHVCAFAFVGIQHCHSFTHRPQCCQQWHR